MKILIVNTSNDLRFMRLMKCFSGLEHKHVIGITSDFMAVQEFDPEIVISDVIFYSEADKFIYVDVNTLPPFTIMQNNLRDDRYQGYYSYVGSIQPFGNSFARLVHSGANLRVYDSTPIPFSFYAGSLDPGDRLKVYHNSRYTIVESYVTSTNLLDILSAKGRPIKYDVNYLIDMFNGNAVYDPPSITRQEVLDKHTNFNVLLDILQKNDVNSSLVEDIHENYGSVRQSCL